jgi:hypothetical protein
MAVPKSSHRAEPREYRPELRAVELITRPSAAEVRLGDRPRSRNDPRAASLTHRDGDRLALPRVNK